MNKSRVLNDISYLDNKHSFAFGVKNASAEFKSAGTSYAMEPFFEFSTSSDNPFRISVNSPIFFTTKSDDADNSFSPRVSMEGTINLNGVIDNSTKLNLQKAKMLQNSNEEKASYQFAKRVYSALSSCINAEINYKKSTLNAQKASKEYLVDLSLDNLTLDSLTEKSAQISLRALEVENELLLAIYENSKANFLSLCGFEYASLASLDEKIGENELSSALSFEFDILERGNSDIRSKYYDFLIAQNKAELSKNGGYKLKLSADTQYSSIDNIYSFNANTSLSSDYLKISAGFGADVDKRALENPKIDLSLSLSPDKSIDVDKKRSESYLLDAQSKYIDYQYEYQEYLANSIKAKSELESARANYDLISIKYDYAISEYENNKALSLLGYKSSDDDATSEFNLQSAKAEYYKSFLSLLDKILDARILNL